VVLAWPDDQGRIRVVRGVHAVEPSGTPTGVLASGAANDFLVALPESDAAEVHGAEPMIWAGGS
jgi:hypothetical protein